MTDQLTSSGLEISTLEERISAIKSAMRSQIAANLDLSSDQPSGQFVEITSENIQQVAELLEEIFSMFDPDAATGIILSALSLLTGTQRRDATEGTVTLDLGLDAAVTVPDGSIVADASDPDNRWVTDEDVTSVLAGTYQVTATCETAGEIQALTGSLTQIVTTITGWNTVTNPADATPGRDRETDPELRLRRELEVTLGGSTSVDSVTAAISALEWIIHVITYENDFHVAVSPLPPNSLEVVYWDGLAATSADEKAELASTIFDEKPAGIRPYGTETITHTDESGNDHIVGFTKATEKVVELEYTMITGTDYPGDSDFAAEVAAYDDSNLTIGDNVFISRYIAIGMSVAGVENITQLRIRFTGDPWGTSDLTVEEREIATIDSSDITVI